MKRLVLASVGFLAVASIMGSANAADMERRAAAMPVKAVPYTNLYNWTGLYIGINGGGGFGGSDSRDGGLVGGTIGYNYQVGQAVFGIETDLDWAHISGSSTCAVGVSCDSQIDYIGTVRGRIGYAFDRFMPYVTGGFAYGGVKNSIAGLGDSTTTQTGYTIGGGLEASLVGPWTAKVEYLYVDLGNSDDPFGDVKNTTNLVRAGLNYRF